MKQKLLISILLNKFTLISFSFSAWLNIIIRHVKKLPTKAMRYYEFAKLNFKDIKNKIEGT